MRKILSFLIAISVPVLAHAQMPVQTAPHDQLTRIIDDHWAWYLSTHPVEATARGVRAYDDRISDMSLSARDAQIKAEQGFVSRLDAVPAQQLDAADRVNRDVLLWMLRDDIDGDKHPAERLMLFTTYYGWHQGFSGMADGLPFYNRADYDSYLKRLALYPKMNGDALAITRQAIKGGYVQPCSVLQNYAGTISGIVDGKPGETRFYEPFARAKPRDISDADWSAMLRGQRS